MYLESILRTAQADILRDIRHFRNTVGRRVEGKIRDELFGIFIPILKTFRQEREACIKNQTMGDAQRMHDLMHAFADNIVIFSKKKIKIFT